MNTLAKFSTNAISYCFYAIFFFVPLIFLPFSYELFEFNKMMLTYVLTLLVALLWATKMIAEKQVKLRKTPLDIPLFLFLLSQIISTVVSIDPHTSWWGYYSRFNGGLFSLLSYIFLYYAAINNLSFDKTIRLLRVSIISGALIAGYAVLEHMGIDKDYWVQDVQNRVFSTLGQPNWLAAYLSVLFFIATALGINTILTTKASKKYNWQKYIFFLFIVLFYIGIIFTRSRSGFAGLWVGIGLLGVWYLFQYATVFRKKLHSAFASSHRYVLLLLVAFLVSMFFFATPFNQLNGFTFDALKVKFAQQNQPAAVEQPAASQGTTALETGGTESGTIRDIVWHGAIDIGKAYPFFGSGVETFAYIYYKFRPEAHNYVSEWDFLYNKAHNEYLNYLATTGFIGLGTYLLFIGVFLFFTLKHLFKMKMDVEAATPNRTHMDEELVDTLHRHHLSIALVAAFVSILISNFFGFSVVIINLFLFVIPAFIFVLDDKWDLGYLVAFPKKIDEKKQVVAAPAWVVITLLVLIVFFMEVGLFRMWFADKDFALAKNYDRLGEFSAAYPLLNSAIQGNPDEPLFQDEASVNAAGLAIAAAEQKQATLSAQLATIATKYSDETIKVSPNNPSFWRTRVRVYYSLAQLEPQFYPTALQAIQKASELAPTDPKIFYNFGLILGQIGQTDQAIQMLEKAVSLKSDYRDANYALGLFYHDSSVDANGHITNQDRYNKAIAQMEKLLKATPNDGQAKEKLAEWKK